MKGKILVYFNIAIKLVITLFLAITIVGCSFHLPKTITGEVVDESGMPLSDVAVRVCYSGWGWDNYLVWDENYCSEPVFTDSHGLYVADFSGFLLPWSPASNSITLSAKKDGWTQTESVYIPNTRIIMADNEKLRERRIAELRSSKSNFQLQLPDEPERDYYCRVILPQNRPVNLIYKGERLSVTPSILRSSDGNQALFALSGSLRVINSFLEEARLKVNRQNLNVNFMLIPAVKSCTEDIQFMSANIPDLYLDSDSELEMFVPSIRAVFNMRIWHSSADQILVQ